MNKQRIAELREKSMPAVENNNGLGLWNNGLVNDWYEQWFENFAELIVRECVEICDAKRTEYTKLCKDADNFTDKNLWAEGEISAHRIRTSIQEHFGVE